MPPGAKHWTPERVQYVRDNYKTMSAARIADHLGEPFTRNSVIGKAHREGLQADFRLVPFRRRTGELATRKSTISPRGRIIVQQEKPMDEIKLKVLRGPVTIMDLEQWHCREIVREKPVVLYCGHPKVQGSSYCIDHHRKNHHTVSNSRVEKYYGL